MSILLFNKHTRFKMILVPNSDNSCFLLIELNQRKNYLTLKIFLIFIVQRLSFHKNLILYKVYFVLCWYLTWQWCDINFKIISWFPKKYMSNCQAVFLTYLGKKANLWTFLLLNTSKTFIKNHFCLMTRFAFLIISKKLQKRDSS